MGNRLTLASSAVIKVAIYQNTEGDRYRFERQRTVGRSKSLFGLFDTDVVITGPSGFVLVYTTPSVKVTTLAGNDVFPAPDIIINGTLVATGFKISRGDYIIKQRDRGLEQKAIVARFTDTLFSDVRSAFADLQRVATILTA